jgi:hypothetical protein
VAQINPRSLYIRSGHVNTDDMGNYLLDIDDEVLDAARAQHGTETIKETVDEALRQVSYDRGKTVSRAIDVLVHAKLDDRERAWP